MVITMEGNTNAQNGLAYVQSAAGEFPNFLCPTPQRSKRSHLTKSSPMPLSISANDFHGCCKPRRHG